MSRPDSQMHLSRLIRETTSRRLIPLTLAVIVALTAYACRDITQPIGRSPSKPNFTITNGTVVVSGDSLHGWAFYDDQAGVLCTDATLCRMVDGPTGLPLGTGSAELKVASTSAGKALILAGYAGTRFDHITDLRYATYRQSVDAGNNLAIALQFNVDYDLSDGSTGYMGRMVFEPYQGNGGHVYQNVWKSWDTRAGKWWGTKSSVTKGGVTTINHCVQATPCTWAQLLAAFPAIGVHTVYGAVVLKAGSGWASFTGNVDSLTIGVDSVNTVYNFEVHSPITAVPQHLRTEIEHGSMGTYLPADSDYTAGAVVTYNFSPRAGFDSLVVILDDTVAANSGTIVMDQPHTLQTGADSIVVATSEISDLGGRVMSVLTASDKPAAYSDFLQWYLDRSKAIGSQALGQQLDVATYLTIDPVRDRAALDAFDAALDGYAFVIDHFNGNDYTYYYAPEDYTSSGASVGANGRRLPPRPRTGSHLVRFSPAAPSRRAIAPPVRLAPNSVGGVGAAGGGSVSGAPWPTELTEIVYVNGIHTDELGSIKTADSLSKLVMKMERFLDPVTQSAENVEVTHFWNKDRTEEVRLYDSTHHCMSNYQDALKRPWKSNFVATVRLAACEGKKLSQFFIKNDILQSIGEYVQLKYHLGDPIPDAVELAHLDSTYHSNGYHVIHVAHSQGNMVVAQALPKLQELEHKPLQRTLCTALVTMASPVMRSAIPLDGNYLRGFTTKHDILRFVGLVTDPDFPVVTTPQSDSADIAIARATTPEKKLIQEINWGTKIHSVNDTYLGYIPNRTILSAMIDTVHDECAAGSIESPTPLSVEWGVRTKAPFTVYNRNGRVLDGRLVGGGGVHWAVSPDSTIQGIGITDGAEPGDLTLNALHQPLGHMSVTVTPPQHFPGFIREVRTSVWVWHDAFSNSYDPVPPPSGQPSWDGTPGDCSKTIQMTAAENYTNYVQSCSRTYTLEVPADPMPATVGVRALRADYPSGDFYGPGLPVHATPPHTAISQGIVDCGPEYCLRQAVIQSVVYDAIITSDTVCTSDACSGGWPGPVVVNAALRAMPRGLLTPQPKGKPPLNSPFKHETP